LPERVDSCAGHYERQLQTKEGEVTLKAPKLRKLPFESAIIERYRRREISVEKVLVEMYLAGMSVRRVEDTAQKATWNSRAIFVVGASDGSGQITCRPEMAGQWR